MQRHPQSQTPRLTLFAAAAVLCLGITPASHAQQQQPFPMFSGRHPRTQPNTTPAPPPASTLPPTQPTAATVPLAATPVTQPTTPAHHADVSYNNGLLTVRANDSSLHQILRSISRQTGMKVTGGVTDQRVFGDYGPADSSTVIATLIDGTGVNMLLRQGDANIPVELILTPRTAGASPPSFDASAQDAETDSAPPAQNPSNVPPPLRSDRVPPRSPGGQQSPSDRAAAAAQGLQPSGPVPSSVLGSENNTTPTASELPTTNSVPVDSLPTPATAVGGPGIVDSTPPTAALTNATPTDSTTTPPADGTNPTSPNGVKTPEQIYQMLLQMQQQQQNKPPPQ